MSNVRGALYIIRGLPGSGKTALANQLAPSSNYAADMYFECAGGYAFDRNLLPRAHEWCRLAVEASMRGDSPAMVIAVHNTFTTNEEIRPYLEIAEGQNYAPFVLHCENRFDSVHNVPAETIGRMRGRWQSFA